MAENYDGPQFKRVEFNSYENEEYDLNETLKNLPQTSLTFSSGATGKAFVLSHKYFANKMCVKWIAVNPGCSNLEDIRREAEIQKMFNHQYIVPLVKKVESKNESNGEIESVFLIMPYYPLKDLFYYILDQPNCIIQIKDVKCICKQILEALIYMNSLNFFHNDLKMENILIKRENGSLVAALCDFGYTKQIRDPKNNYNIIIYRDNQGTISYDSPEKLLDLGCMYTFGVNFYLN